MKKQFHKIKAAAENLSRSSRSENKNDELSKVEKHVEKYKDVLEKIYKKFSSSPGAEQDREKRIKKVHEYRLGQVLDEAAKDLPSDLVLYQVLNKCGELEKSIANHIIENEIQTENGVTKKMKQILESDIQEIATHKRMVSRYLQEYNSIKKAYENAQRSNENAIKLNQLKSEQEECEQKLEKERDYWAAQMFDLIAKDEVIANSVRTFVTAQKIYYESALKDVENALLEINEIVEKCQKKRIFGVTLQNHLRSTNREISYVIELCVCCLMERGLNEEGLLRVGCAGTKLKRMKNAIDAQYVYPPLPSEYQDIHVIASILKSYLRELPEPLLTYDLYRNFMQAAQKQTEIERKEEILNTINKLPRENYKNLRYLTRFLWHLYRNQDQNKMTSQNIAIVMSPNILWPPETNSNLYDYACQVNSSAAVNTIVEVLVSDWSYFFSGEVDFFINFSKDNLFTDVGANNSLTSSIHVGENAQFLADNTSATNIQQSQITFQNLQINQQISQNSLQQTINNNSNNNNNNNYQTHSRSSSHDTSRILIGSVENTLATKSYSNDSLSENSSPTYAESPRLPERRKHRKPSAPVPPNKAGGSVMTTSDGGSNLNLDMQENDTNSSFSEKRQEFSTISTGSSNKCDGSSQTPPLTEKGAINRPDKPPRPAPVECFTLNRSTYKNKSIEKLPPSGQKPVALPRTMLNVAKSTENLSTSGADDTVQLREKTESKEKPAIPERPATLMRPTSFRTDGQYQLAQHSSAQQPQQYNNLSEAKQSLATETGINNSGAVANSIKKASSFRMNSNNSFPSSAQNNDNEIQNNSLHHITNSTTSINSTSSSISGKAANNNNNKMTLERAQIYSVDKKQVAIIDVTSTETCTTFTPTTVEAMSGNNTFCEKISSPVKDENSPTYADSAISSSKDFILCEQNNSSGSTAVTPQGTQVPPSPRGFDVKIKRPQIPAPPPPTNRRKSDGALGDSTHL